MPVSFRTETLLEDFLIWLICLLRRFCEQLVQTAQRRGIGNAMLPQRVDHYTESSMYFFVNF